MHKKLIKDIIARADRTDMEKLEYIMCEALEDLKRKDLTCYKHVKHKLYKIAYGDHLNEELAYEWVSSMENKDGTIGEHWNKSQTDAYAGDYNKWDWYAAMNMAYSDHYNPKFDTTMYIEFAKDWIDDKDVDEGKTLRYYMYVVCD